jgi:hypothetical protein
MNRGRNMKIVAVLITLAIIAALSISLAMPEQLTFQLRNTTLSGSKEKNEGKPQRAMKGCYVISALLVQIPCGKTVA